MSIFFFDVGPILVTCQHIVQPQQLFQWIKLNSPYKMTIYKANSIILYYIVLMLNLQAWVSIYYWERVGMISSCFPQNGILGSIPCMKTIDWPGTQTNQYMISAFADRKTMRVKVVRQLFSLCRTRKETQDSKNSYLFTYCLRVYSNCYIL